MMFAAMTTLVLLFRYEVASLTTVQSAMLLSSTIDGSFPLQSSTPLTFMTTNIYGSSFVPSSNPVYTSAHVSYSLQSSKLEFTTMYEASTVQTFNPSSSNIYEPSPVQSLSPVPSSMTTTRSTPSSPPGIIVTSPRNSSSSMFKHHSHTLITVISLLVLVFHKLYK